MQLVSFVGGFGRVEGEQIRPLGPSLIDYLENSVAQEGELLNIKDVSILAPVPKPSKVICIGLNYRDHAIESGLDIPSKPVVFGKWSNSVVGPGSTVIIPPETHQADYEVELGVVIGRRVKQISSALALEAVGGYTILNDLSARDLQSSSSQWTYGKAIDGFLPMGPYLLTPDEILDPQCLSLGLSVNGELRQSSNTSQMIFGIAELISYLSRVMTLEPGDVIATGTPPGVGMGMSPPHWLRPGDEISAWIDGFGVLDTHMS